MPDSMMNMFSAVSPSSYTMSLSEIFTRTSLSRSFSTCGNTPRAEALLRERRARARRARTPGGGRASMRRWGNVTSFYGSSCADNGKGALSTQETLQCGGGVYDCLGVAVVR
eukprot:1195214-Prorocentrum_minimum.AAC.6